MATAVVSIIGTFQLGSATTNLRQRKLTVRISIMFAGMLLGLGLGLPVQAERPDHFKGKSAETLDAALINLAEANRELAAMLEQPTLTPEDMVKVHELSYTQENALEKVKAEFAAMAQSLEEVHVASERMDASTVKASGGRYLDTARHLLRQP